MPEAFFSSLRNCNTLGHGAAEIQRNYDGLKAMWIERGWRTMRDMLIHYSSQDVLPFLSAFQQMQTYYRDHKAIDLFRDGISVPGLARRLLFRCARSFPFALFSAQDEDLFQLYRRQLVGGPSVIYHRLAEAHKTPVEPDSDAEMCSSVCGYDVNGLYSFCLRSRMPVGLHIRWKPIDGDDPETSFRAASSQKYMACYHWLEYESKRQNCFVQHFLNTGYEINLGGYLLDGFSPDTNTAWEFNGCWAHGCD